MAERLPKQYIFASDFDQTLSFNDTGYVLSEVVGIPVEEFERKVRGMVELNLVQQGGELSYLLLHDPEFRSRVRKQHLYEAGKQIRLKHNIDLLYRILGGDIDGYRFTMYVISAAPVEVIQSALEGLGPPTTSSAPSSTTPPRARSGRFAAAWPVTARSPSSTGCTWTCR